MAWGWVNCHFNHSFRWARVRTQSIRTHRCKTIFVYMSNPFLIHICSLSSAHYLVFISCCWWFNFCVWHSLQKKVIYHVSNFVQTNKNDMALFWFTWCQIILVSDVLVCATQCRLVSKRVVYFSYLSWWGLLRKIHSETKNILNSHNKIG